MRSFGLLDHEQLTLGSPLPLPGSVVQWLTLCSLKTTIVPQNDSSWFRDGTIFISVTQPIMETFTPWSQVTSMSQIRTLGWPQSLCDTNSLGFDT